MRPALETRTPGINRSNRREAARMAKRLTSKDRCLQNEPGARKGDRQNGPVLMAGHVCSAMRLTTTAPTEASRAAPARIPTRPYSAAAPNLAPSRRQPDDRCRPGIWPTAERASATSPQHHPDDRANHHRAHNRTHRVLPCHALKLGRKCPGTFLGRGGKLGTCVRHPACGACHLRGNGLAHAAHGFRRLATRMGSEACEVVPQVREIAAQVVDLFVQSIPRTILGIKRTG